MLDSGRRLNELRAVGPWVARIVEGWIADPPEVPEPPELRRGFLTMAEALRVLEESDGPDLRGDLQVHTTWSDGSASLEEMARHARDLGHDYIGVTDHSKGLPIAGGMDEATLMRQWDEIDATNARLEPAGIRILRSLEMNISPEGEGDMDPDVLGQLDLVLGAFHSKLRIKEDQTERYLAAVRNPDVHVLAHPRGRRWNARTGLYADWPRVFEAAADAGTALEIDSFADRQDLQVDLLRVAVEAGVLLSLGPDAHHPEDLRFLPLGVAAATLAGVPADRILNTRAADEVAAAVRAPG